MYRQPNDEITRILAGLMEKLIRDIGDDDTRRMVGFTIIASSGDNQDENDRVEKNPKDTYEIVEGPDRIFITSELPAELTTAPYVDIRPDQVVLFIEGTETVIELPAKIDVIRSSYQIRRRTLDILCYKH
jgi:hypothetical protein